MVLRVGAAICGAVILFVYSSSAMAKLGTVNVHSTNSEYAYFGTSTAAGRRDACATSRDKKRCIAARASMGGSIVGTASMYDPLLPGYHEGGIETASGELSRGEMPYAIANALEVERHTVARRNSHEALRVFSVGSFHEPIARLRG